MAIFIYYDMSTFYTPIYKLVPETVSVSDNPVTSIIQSKLGNEEVILSEIGFASISRSRFLQENITILESTNSNIVKYRALSETLTIIDSPVAHKIYPVHSLDIISLVETVSTYIYDSTGKSKDTVEIIESATSSIQKYNSGNDSIEITDTAIGFLAVRVFKYEAETVSIVDTGTYSIFNPILLPNLETINITDTSFILLTRIRSLPETITVSDITDTYINSIGAGSIPQVILENVNIVETEKTEIYHFKTGSDKHGFIYSSYFTPEYLYSRVEKLTTTSFISGDIRVVPRLSILDGEVPILYTSYYSTAHTYMLVQDKRINVHQIKTIPEGAELDYGFIKEDEIKDFTILSGEPEDLVVEEILIPEFFGVVLVGLEVGSILPAGGELNFGVLAYSDVGRDTIDDFLTIHFVGDQKVQIFIKILRVLVFDFFITPDANSYSESISLYTQFFDSISNIRKSMPLMVAPKYAVKYDVTMHSTRKHRVFLNIFRKGLKTPILHPLWGQSLLIDVYKENAFLIECAWEDCDFEVGDRVFVFKNVDEYRVATIVALTAGQMLLSKKFSFEPGFIITPSFTGVVKGTVRTTYTGEPYAKGTIEVEELILDV